MKWTCNKVLFAAVLGTALVWSGAPAAQKVAPPHGSRIVLRDLRAVRKGNKVELIWSQPQSTVNHLVSANICRSISSKVPALSEPIAACAQSVGKVALRKSSGAVANATYGKSNTEITMRFTDSLPEDPENESLQFAVYNLELRDDRGRIAGFSNSVPVF